MKEEQTNSFLETEHLSRLMAQYAIPCIISLLVGALYNIVDQIFIANASYLGSYGNAANTVVYPLTVAALAIAVMIGDGCCAHVSICLGRGSRKDASHSVGTSITLCILVSAAVTALYFIFRDPLLTIFGGRVNEQTFLRSIEYFNIIAPGLPFYMFGQACNPIIRSDGSPKFAMAASLSGAIANIILDPIFIFFFQWGMAGAAAATVLGQILTAALSVWYMKKMKNISLQKECFRIQFPLLKKILPLGMTSFLSQISMVAAMLAIQNMVVKYSGLDPIFSQAEYAQIPMAVLGIVMKFFQIIISIVIGMTAGCIPIAGYNMGAGRKDRERKLFGMLLFGETCVGICGLIIAEVFPEQLISIFGAANESTYYTEFAIRSFRIYLCMMIPACINKAAFIYLQAMGKAFSSTILSLLRELVFGVGLALILPLYFGLDGVLYSMPAADIIAFVFSLTVIIHIFHSEAEDQVQKVLA
jgi:putative MATE family efflux protein